MFAFPKVCSVLRYHVQSLQQDLHQKQYAPSPSVGDDGRHNERLLFHVNHMQLTN